MGLINHVIVVNIIINKMSIFKKKRHDAIHAGVIKTILTLCLGLVFSCVTYGQQVGSEQTTAPFAVAPVKLDGNILFNVRGISSMPATQRAENISQRIKKVAENDSFPADSLQIIEVEDQSSIYAGDIVIMQIYEPDAAMEGVSRQLLANSNAGKIKDTLSLYRYARSRPVIINNLLHAGVATVIMILIMFFVLWLVKRSNKFFQNKIKHRIESVENISFKLIKSNQIWRVFHVLFDTLRVILIIFLVVFYIEYVLTLFPWTNEFAKYALGLITDPIISIGTDFINYIPSFIFILIIFFVTKYLLKLIRLFFTGIEDGGIIIRDFSAEWAAATFKIIRLGVISFAIIIAYPYIPGSQSVAFKGVSVFIGLIFSLGSSSFISNAIAGYSMIYRGAFKKGDRIEVDNQIGFVEEQKLLITRLRSHKNEEIIIPNSLMLNSKIINFTARAKELGLVIHTIVGIGYETPWRQVDAMMKLAADRTEGLLKQPPPFVLKKSLGDFAVNYEINAYCKEIPNISGIYTALHQNILDVFNENNVQIMTPNYVADTEIPKVVPKEQWDTPLAKESGRPNTNK
jgi:small-conductance mechanosensitive channel